MDRLETILTQLMYNRDDVRYIQDNFPDIETNELNSYSKISFNVDQNDTLIKNINKYMWIEKDRYKFTVVLGTMNRMKSGLVEIFKDRELNHELFNKIQDKKCFMLLSGDGAVSLAHTDLILLITKNPVEVSDLIDNREAKIYWELVDRDITDSNVFHCNFSISSVISLFKRLEKHGTGLFDKYIDRLITRDTYNTQNTQDRDMLEVQEFNESMRYLINNETNITNILKMFVYILTKPKL